MTDGARWEALALDFLRRRGLALLERNYRCRLGEIDLLMRDGVVLVVVEVRYRADDRHGGAGASVTPAKRARLTRATRHWLARHGGEDGWPVRFDVVAISGDPARARIDWRRAAFDAV